MARTVADIVVATLRRLVCAGSMGFLATRSTTVG